MDSYEQEEQWRSKKHDELTKADKINTEKHIQLERDYSNGKITKRQYDVRYRKLSSEWKTKESRTIDEGAGRVKRERRSVSQLKGKNMSPVPKKSPSKPKIQTNSPGRRSNNAKVISTSAQAGPGYVGQFVKRDRSKNTVRTRSSGRKKGNVHEKFIKGTTANDERRRENAVKKYQQQQTKSSSGGGVSKAGFNRGMAKLMKSGKTKQQAYQSMSAMVKAQRKK
ncbi:MAG TPA: hypothetical protein DCG34_08830 [Clostridiales bacterium]|nr:hypothetical protein [Clostridiales bacterium]